MSLIDPVLTFERSLMQTRDHPLNIEMLIELAGEALATGREADVVHLVEYAAEQYQSVATLWQWSGLLNRALDRHEAAMAGFSRAACLAPTSALIHHSLARTQLEAGLHAVTAFDTALYYGPTDASVLLGRVAALLACGRATCALSEIDAILVKNPGWIAGHETAAKLRWSTGQQEEFLTSLDLALQMHPRDHELWRLKVNLLMQAQQYESALAAISCAYSQIGDQRFLLVQRAAADGELGRIAEADAHYARLDAINDDSNNSVMRMRHLLRAGRIDEAAQYGERCIVRNSANSIWPYLGVAWRLLNDRRWEWYEADHNLIKTYDIASTLPSLDELTHVLKQLHNTANRPLDQTVRGGTQTDGNLFRRLDAPIRSLRASVLDAVHTYLGQLAPVQVGHPTLAQPRDRMVRFAGAWSVRLTSCGFHVSHTHPLGWLSSVFYVELPSSIEDCDQQDGWLVLGSPPPELLTGLPPIRAIKPKVGQLVLFPSTMWHGTSPFREGERLAVAFDIAQPK